MIWIMVEKVVLVFFEDIIAQEKYSREGVKDGKGAVS